MGLLTFPSYASKNMRGIHQSILDSLNIKLYRCGSDSNEVFQRGCDGKLIIMSENEAVDLEGVVRESDPLEMINRGEVYQVNYVFPEDYYNSENKKTTKKGTKFPVLRFHHLQIPESCRNKFPVKK